MSHQHGMTGQRLYGCHCFCWNVLCERSSVNYSLQNLHSLFLPSHQQSHIAMGYCSNSRKISRKSKYVILLILVLSVLAWIAIFSREMVKPIWHYPGTQQTHVKEESQRNEVDLQIEAANEINTPPQKTKCPQESPLLSKYRTKCYLDAFV